jgi:FkbM family methyltransferase
VRRTLVRGVKHILHRVGIDVVRYRTPEPKHALNDALNILGEFRELADRQANNEEAAFLDFCAFNYRSSKAQLFQDLFVLNELGQKPGGFFVEFGATNGIDLSNTYALEKRHGWNGILAEPATCWHEALRGNRNCRLDFRCVWDSNDEQLEFNQVTDAELSTVNSFSSSDLHAKTRREGNLYMVSTVSLNSLLDENKAPEQIDYLSIDTEGSEFKILSAFDFRKYKIKVITVEHNYTTDRSAIHSLLSSNGFIRKFEVLSLWDDWYVAADFHK